jgi:colanic acid/amylovoran/stewartan biosynthesis glycosyltransferase WcaL/AmsK/CpsK
MKLAIFVDHFPSLSQSFVTNQVVGLHKAGVDVTVVALSGNSSQIPIGIDLSQVSVIYLFNEEEGTKKSKLVKRSKRVLKGLFFSPQRKKILSALSWRYGHHAKSLLLANIASNVTKPLVFDVVLCHFGFNGILVSKLRELGLIRGKIATIFHGHDISAHQSLRQYTNDYQKLFKQTELMLPISERWKNKLIELGCPKEKIIVHRMGVDLTIFKPREKQANLQEELKLGNNKDAKIISSNESNLLQQAATYTADNGAPLILFTVARFSEKKGLKYAIQSLALLPNIIKFHYYLAGFGELETELKTLVSKLKLNNKITFLGALEQCEVTHWMLKADIFMQPSITANNGDMEGVPVAIMEAMAMKIPVVSTFHSGIPELIEHQKHGLLAPEKNSQVLADNIALLYNDKQLGEQLTRSARSKIERIADVEKLNQRLIKILTT